MSLEQFFEPEDQEDLYTPAINLETRNRIKLCIAAYAYEYLNRPIMSDAEFDQLSVNIDLSIKTRRPELDAWFKRNFEPHTGMWIHSHPEKNLLDYFAKLILKDRDI